MERHSRIWQSHDEPTFVNLEQMLDLLPIYRISPSEKATINWAGASPALKKNDQKYSGQFVQQRKGIVRIEGDNRL